MRSSKGGVGILASDSPIFGLVENIIAFARSETLRSNRYLRSPSANSTRSSNSVVQKILPHEFFFSGWASATSSMFADDAHSS